MNIFQKCISLFIAVMTVFAAQAKNYEVKKRRQPTPLTTER